VNALKLVSVTTDNLPLFQRRIMYIERSAFVSPWTLNCFKNELRNPISRIWGAVDDEGLAGFICFWVVAGEVHLLNIAVAPERRGLGTGTYLLSRMIVFAEGMGVDRIWLEVRPSNSAALALYRGAGFIEEGRRARYYSDTGEDAILMSLYLHPCRDRPEFFFETGDDAFGAVGRSREAPGLFGPRKDPLRF